MYIYESLITCGAQFTTIYRNEELESVLVRKQSTCSRHLIFLVHPKARILGESYAVNINKLTLLLCTSKAKR